MAEIDKPGSFFLGRPHDISKKKTGTEPLLYDSKDLTTHAVCVGMTGSGKTGLCLALLEEAALNGIPAIAIDPKGDLGNLLLAFPKLEPSDFRPWIDESEAARKKMSPDDFAASQAELWRKGLASWDEGPERIRRFCDTVDRVIYTPGSSAGIPITVLKSFSAPPAELVADADAFSERVSSATSGLLALMGVDSDPVRGREHIFVSTLLDTAWRAGKDVDLRQLIQDINRPPITKVGAVDLESFYPAKERNKLAMTLNNLLASPSFAAWMEGEPLDIQRILYTPDKKPRLAIMSIAHLDDAQRMFFVTILLNEILAWIRTQPGTSSLRAIALHGRSVRLLPADREPAGEAADAHAAQAGPRVRPWLRAGDAEPGRSRLQRTVERRHLVLGPAANGARQGPRDRRARRRVGPSGLDVQSPGDGSHARRTREPRVPDEQRARRCACGVRIAVGDVVSLRAAYEEPNQNA